MMDTHSIKVDTEVYLKLNDMKLKSKEREIRKKHNSINSVLREVLGLENE